MQHTTQEIVILGEARIIYVRPGVLFFCSSTKTAIGFILRPNLSNLKFLKSQIILSAEATQEW